ncbi:hypothetical protein B0H17DRAFT_1163650 [Mycena rosella]|uniref:Uncharacterized protein n=1 Tax=Mycena rosella TaxID=1033263 RepID=A0AAD7CLW2_MYCRO|nr:hypothetical protein B0H17DRAFT_1163650 [Mycena rosella]
MQFSRPVSEFATSAAAAAAPADAAASSAAIALQSSLTLDPSVICTNFTDDGQTPPTAGQSASSTSTNNYINFCSLTLPGVPLTNGGQITTGSCNPAPLGFIPSIANMPTSKFTFPQNMATIPADTSFNLNMAVKGMEGGTFTNAAATYLANPQFLNSEGHISGHVNVVVEVLSSIDQTAAMDPRKFFLFKTIGDAADSNGIVSTPVQTGVPAGFYRVCSIYAAANRQPVIVAVEQHGSLNDCIFFTAVAGGDSSGPNSTVASHAISTPTAKESVPSMRR